MIRKAVFARSRWRKPTGRGAYAREMLLGLKRTGRPVDNDLFSGDDTRLLPRLDAMSVGSPVLASDISIHREVLGEAAPYFASHDSRAPEAVIRQLLWNEDERGRLPGSERARAGAFSWDFPALRIWEVLEHLAIQSRRLPVAEGRRL